MGHRYMFNTPQILETSNDQGWDHAQQPFIPMARVSTSESSSHVRPVENMIIQGGPSPSPWTPASPSGYSSPICNVELPHYQPQVPGPSYDPQPTCGNFHMVPDNYAHHPSSSSLSGQTGPGVDGNFYNQPMDSGRGYKRKSPVIPQLCDRGSTSTYYDAGSSSNLHLPADQWQEKRDTESYHTLWDYTPDYRADSLSIGSENALRNVRSRTGVDLEPNLSRTHLSSNYLHHSFSSPSSDQAHLVDLSGQSSSTQTREWNRRLLSPTGHEVTFGADSSSSSHDLNTMNALNNYANDSVEREVHSNNAANRSPVPEDANTNLNRPARVTRHSYSQRSLPAFRASSSNFHPEQIVASDEGLQMDADSYSSRYRRIFAAIRWRNSGRHRRAGISSDRHRSVIEEASHHDHLTPEDVMFGDHSALHGSRTPFDQHMDMRLDIDNMSYEELLDLGETIGSVSTGLSDNLISKCLTESIYCSSDLFQDDGKCVICLEEYKYMDDVGSLKCRHDFHVSCIKQWLSMKNLCPICKASAMDDSKKDT